MRKILFIVLFVLGCFYGCDGSGDKDEVKPKYEISDGIHPSKERIWEAVKDKSGLTLSRVGICFEVNDTSFLVVGLKNKKLWFGCFDGDTKNITERYTWTSKKDFVDSIYVEDKGYGVKDTLTISLNRGFELGGMEGYLVSKDTFAINIQVVNGVSKYFAIYVNGQNVHNKNIEVRGFWTNKYYLTSLFDNYDYGKFISGLDGSSIYELYPFKSNNLVALSLYECIQRVDDNNTVRFIKNNSQTGEEIWSTIIKYPGKVIDGMKPIVKYQYSVTSTAVIVTFDVTNYDGTKSTEIVTIQLNTGNIIE